MGLQKAKHCTCCGCPTTQQCLWCCDGGGACPIARKRSNDKERAAQPGSDACVIVVVAKCSWLIIPPSFANGAAAHLHINGGKRRVWCQGVRVKRVAKLEEHRGHHPLQQTAPPPHTPSRLQSPQHYHDTPCRVRLINRHNRMEDRLLFGRGGGCGWHSEELSVKSAGCPWISLVVTQPCAPWRSFRQLSRTRPAAVLNSSLQRPTPDEQLQHTGQFPYKTPPPPSLLPFTHSSSAYASRQFDCANEHTTPPHPKHTHALLATVWWEVHDAARLTHTEKQAPVKDNSASYLPLSAGRNWKVLEFFFIMQNIPRQFVKLMGALAWGEYIPSEVRAQCPFRYWWEKIEAPDCVWIIKKEIATFCWYRCTFQMKILA